MGKFKQLMIQALDESNYLRHNGYLNKGEQDDQKTNNKEKKFDSKRIANKSSLQAEEADFFKKIQS